MSLGDAIPFPLALSARADALRSRIQAAFNGIHRTGGVSWSETREIDFHKSESDRKAARANDLDQSWLEVANNPDWRPDQGVGGWHFLDPIGFRYYVPAGMNVALLKGEDVCLDYPIVSALRDRDERWLILDRPQRECIRDYVFLMRDALIENDNIINAATFQEACDFDWEELLAVS